MIPRAAKPEEAAALAAEFGAARAVVYAADDPTFHPCPATVTPAPADTEVSGTLVHVAYQLDEIELAHLARGGTLWLRLFGGLPPHVLEVVPR